MCPTAPQSSVAAKRERGPPRQTTGVQSHVQPWPRTKGHPCSVVQSLAPWTLKAGENVSPPNPILYRLDWSAGPRLEPDRDAISRRPSRTCTFQGDAERSTAKGCNVHALRSVPMGVLGQCPACGGETSIRLIEPMTAQGVERRTFECKQCHERQAFIVARVSEVPHVMRH